MQKKMLCHGGDRYRHPNTIDFSANCNCFGMPDEVRKAAIEGVEQSIYYPDPVSEQVRRALANYESVEPAQVLCGNGASELIMTLARALEVKRVLLISPDFSEYERAFRTAKSEIEYFELKRENAFAWSDDFLQELKQTKADCVVFSNPHNPTGGVMSPAILKEVIMLTAERGCRLVIDECFMEFAKSYENYSAKQFLSQNKHLVILKAFTKTFSCPGLRIGYLLSADGQLIDRCNDNLPEWNLSLAAQYAAIAATGEKEWLLKTTEIIREERVRVSGKLRELGLTVYDSEVNYIFFSGPKGLYEKSLKQGFLIRDCANYRGLTDGDYRICVRKQEENERLLMMFAKERKRKE
ncbi:MAG: histidinol-phosphate transaminase [bacterium]|nr:histidinol-phosphate transaminase [bacterium]